MQYTLKCCILEGFGGPPDGKSLFFCMVFCPDRSCGEPLKEGYCHLYTVTCIQLHVYCDLYIVTCIVILVDLYCYIVIDINDTVWI